MGMIGIQRGRKSKPKTIFLPLCSSFPSVRFFSANQQRTRGHPVYVISREQLEFFIEAGFTRRQMADLLHVSDSSVKRRLRSFGLKLRQTYSVLSNNALDDLVREVTQGNPSLGQRMVQGLLQSRGHRVQRQRVADSLIRVDAAAVALRWCHSIRRRVYKVAAPNSLWHIDGNHKLIRWGFVVHGGIDGYSRLCVFLKVSTNNRATTMTKAFINGTRQYGVPSRVRSDKGLENTGVGAFMISYRGPGRGSFITGKSVHNQRIERLWRDMYSACTNVFHQLFQHLEETGRLDLSSEVHMWCLHLVYVPLIQRALDRFRDGWNCHRLSEERGRTPTQLYLQGMIEHAGRGHRGVDDMFFEPQEEQLSVSEEDYGVDEEAPVASANDDELQVSSVTTPIDHEQMAELTNRIRPLDSEDGLAVDLFEQAVSFCSQALNI
ncbi:uncharacterized protein LOC127873051 isoform X2 [Dreissena polymorpha]|uniref:uncharacterized protein LOC127873051 isoform X2 n=1 Tax=Dreissena polymorpha TaxID=45954 RepID=UPI002263B48A|nr:uncharacterized protein LOC127873051 isoform X2 [Dreissena polymorpha]